MSACLASYHYLIVKLSFFDDVFIYLHMARNAIELGTWQYFPVIDRSALLASSPLKLVLLTIGTAVGALVGASERSLDNAQFILLLTGFFGWLAFAPFWRKRFTLYGIVGTVYLLSATFFSATFDFEGGLLFLWLVTVVSIFSDEDFRSRDFAVVLPIGGLIRPDLSLIVYFALLAVVCTDVRVRERLRWMPWGWILLAPAVWVILALSFSVYPIPVTYWTKAAIPRLIESTSFLQVLVERVGVVLNAPGAVSSNGASVTGALLLVLSIVITLPRVRNPAAVGVLVAVVSIGLFSRMPSSFWWYYENIVMMLAAVLLANALFERRSRFAFARVASGLLIAFVLLLGGGAKSLRDQPGAWSFGQDAMGRTKGYLYLAQHANGDGTYTLPELGRVILKNPEMGITSYFSGKGAWIWDSAGLAQPVDMPAVKKSLLKHAYPRSLRVGAVEDAKKISDRSGGRIKVVEAWAMDDRDYDKARKICQYVIVEAALCVNPFMLIDSERL